MSDSESSSSLSESDPCGVRAVRPELVAPKIAKVTSEPEHIPPVADKPLVHGLIDPEELLGSDQLELKILVAHKELMLDQDIARRKRRREKHEKKSADVDAQFKDSQFTLPEIEAHIPINMFELNEYLSKKDNEQAESKLKRQTEKDERWKASSNLKDREKKKRQLGQSSHATWKSETEMSLRQGFDG
eukprot:GHVH01003648.1.p1 GENE.GHVH01003648.1~~GHVH01003648.1.p1  ORF type:complete len:188 (+),score=27.50 GHVH01003648.1:28-591(+)